MTSVGELPKGVQRVIATIFPDASFEGVSFHEGLPPYVVSQQRAITVGPKIYFRTGEFEPCSFKGLALVAHELLHIQQGAGGFGWWFLRWFYIKYVWLLATHGFTSGRKHPMEGPGYDLQDKVEDHWSRVQQSTGQDGPCTDSAGNDVGLNEVFVDAFAAEWARS